MGLSGNNKFVIASPKAQLTHIRFPVAFGKIGSTEFTRAIGNTNQYEKVFIHQFSPLLYKWVATNSFKQLNWAIWGGDLYNLPGFDTFLYEPQTLKFVRSRFSLSEFLYQQKIKLLQDRYREKAYAQVDNILTWMKGEYQFAKNHIPSLRAQHQFFFYENDTSYAEVERERFAEATNPGKRKIVLGNSGTPTNNHLDALSFLAASQIEAKVIIPGSYGDKSYMNFLRKKCNQYSAKLEIEFMDKFLSFPDYVKMLRNADEFVSYSIRPQGYGNIFLMMAIGKPVFFNPKNISIPDLDALGIGVQKLNKEFQSQPMRRQEKVSSIFSEERLTKLYGELFS